LLNLLDFPEMDVRENQIHDAENDSCNWITKHEAYILWRRKNGGVLGIRGKPGAGKSTLTKRVFNLLSGMGKDQHVVIAFFFHRRGTAIQYSLIGMYRTLLYRLLEQIPEAGQEFWELAERKQKLKQRNDQSKDVVLDWNSGELRQALTKALLRASKLRPIKIVVDALDEAGNSEAQEIILYLRKINKDLLNLGGHVSICFSCRHYPVIASDEGFEIFVEMHNTEDISKDVSWKLAHLIDCRGPLDKKLHVLKKLHPIIMEKASSIFMWVVLVVPLVARWFNDGKSLEKIKANLSRVPEDLNEVYRHIITQVVDQSGLQQSLLLMQWIFFAKQPLSLADMRYALASDDAAIHIGQKSCEDSEDFIDSDERMHKLITSLTGGLAEVIRLKGIEKIQFVHQSVNDYLLRDQFRSLQGASSENFIGEAHDRLCRSCINYFRLERANLHNEIIAKNFANSVPFYGYAVRYWGPHATKAEFNNVAQHGLVEQFEWPENGDTGTWKTWLKAYKSNFVTEFIDRNNDHYGLKYEPIDHASLLSVVSVFHLRSTLVELLRRGQSLEKRNSNDMTVLHIAAQRGDNLAVEMLLQAGADPNAMYNGGGDLGNVLEVGIIEGHSIQVVQLLLNAGADPNVKLKYFGSALQAAACYCNIDIVQLLLDAGANVNQEGGPYGNALQAAARYCNNDIVQLLLDAGANVNQEGGTYCNALQAAACHCDIGVVQLLLDAGADVNQEGGAYGNSLQAAAYHCDISVVRLLLDAGADVNQEGGTYGTALQAASYRNYFEVVELLLNFGANANARGGKYESPLGVAKRNNRLWKSGSEDQKNRWMKSAEAIIKLLLGAGAEDTG
ncbi:ankyrin repeat-containing domain protein, partial [Bisporella sp. PMI_857]